MKQRRTYPGVTEVRDRFADNYFFGGLNVAESMVDADKTVAIALGYVADEMCRVMDGVYEGGDEGGVFTTGEMMTMQTDLNHEAFEAARASAYGKHMLRMVTGQAYNIDLVASLN